MTTTPHRAVHGRLHAAARAAADRGWPVLPLYPYSRRPAITDWEHHATTDPDQLDRWWAEHPYNIGIACGPAGLVVLDLDTARGRTPPPEVAEHGVTDGRTMLALIAADAGADDPCHTYTVTTPSGGEHRYFRAPPGTGLRNTAGTLGWCIDTRATGGAIVAAGSVRRIHGQLHRYTVARSGPVADLPGWLTTALTPPTSPTTPLPPAGTPTADRYLQAAIDGELAAVAHAVPGTRNHTLFKAAARLGDFVAAGLIEHPEAAALLLGAAARHVGVDGFTDLEARRTITNGLAR